MLLSSAASQNCAYGGPPADYNIAGNEMSLQQWVKHTTIGGGTTQVYQGQFDFFTGQESYAAYYRDSGGSRLRIRITDPAGLQDFVEWPHIPTVGVWEHYTFVWDGTLTVATGSLKLYIAGVDQGAPTIFTANNITSLKASTSAYSVGSFSDGAAAGSYLDATIDEVRVWNVALTGPDILANYNVQIPGATAGLFAYSRFNNDYVEEVSGKNLTPANAPVFTADVPFP